MSATLDGARVAKLLGDAPVVESEGRAFPVETHYLGARSARAASSGRSRTPSCARCAREGGSLLVFLPGAGEIRRTETLLRERIERSRRSTSSRSMARSTRSVQDRAISPRAAGPTQDRAGDLDRRDLAHHRRRAHRDRLRPGARAALRAGCRPDAAGNRARVARRRRSAARPRRPHRARRLLPAVGRAGDRDARAFRAAGNPRRRSLSLRARSRAMGRRAIRQARLSRSAAASARSAKRSTLLPNSTRSTPTAASPKKAASSGPAAAAAAGAHDRGCRARRRGAHGRRHCRDPQRARLGGNDVDLDASARSVPPRTLGPRRGRAPHGEALGRTGGEQSKRRAISRRSARSLALAYPDRVAQAIAAAGPADSCSPMAAARRSIRHPRWRASLFIVVAELTGTAAQSRILLAAPISLARHRAAFRR